MARFDLAETTERVRDICGRPWNSHSQVEAKTCSAVAIKCLESEKKTDTSLFAKVCDDSWKGIPPGTPFIPIPPELIKEQALRILDSEAGCPKCEIEWANGAEECPHCGKMKPEKAAMIDRAIKNMAKTMPDILRKVAQQ
jgi:hypothetical protein